MYLKITFKLLNSFKCYGICVRLDTARCQNALRAEIFMTDSVYGNRSVQYQIGQRKIIDKVSVFLKAFCKYRMDICNINIREFILNHGIIDKVGGGFSIEHITDQLAFITFRTAQCYRIAFVYDLEMIAADFAFQLLRFPFNVE